MLGPIVTHCSGTNPVPVLIPLCVLTSWGTPTTLMKWTSVSCVANRYLVVILQESLKLLSLFILKHYFLQRRISSKITSLLVYRPQTKLREGNVFTPVCDSVHRVGVSVQGGLCPEGFCLGDLFPGGGGLCPGLEGGGSVTVQWKSR